MSQKGGTYEVKRGIVLSHLLSIYKYVIKALGTSFTQAHSRESAQNKIEVISKTLAGIYLSSTI